MKNSHRLRHRMATLGLTALLALSMTPTSGIAYALGMGEGDAPTAAETTPDPAAGAGTSSQGTDGQGADGQTPGAVADEKDSTSNVATPAEKGTASGNEAEAAAPSGDAVTMLRAPQAPVSLTELWVDGAAGDDANDGSASSALKTLAKALELQAADPSVTTMELTVEKPLMTPVAMLEAWPLAALVTSSMSC